MSSCRLGKLSCCIVSNCAIKDDWQLSVTKHRPDRCAVQGKTVDSSCFSCLTVELSTVQFTFQHLPAWFETVHHNSSVRSFAIRIVIKSQLTSTF